MIIPARGGSKGLPGKNIKLLGERPLIHYTINIARKFTTDDHICVTSDSDEIIECAKKTGIDIPFKRPAELATDTAGSYEVLLHALQYYEERGRYYEKVLLMQPTSPFRKLKHLKEVSKLYSPEIGMVVSVGESHYNPYFSLFEENHNGYLDKSKTGSFYRRQDAPKVYFFNGSLYLINVESLKKQPLQNFTKVVKYVMEGIYNQDIDNLLDWLVCETIISKGLYKYEDC